MTTFIDRNTAPVPVEWSSTLAPLTLQQLLHASPDVLIEVEVEGSAAAVRTRIFRRKSPGDAH